MSALAVELARRADAGRPPVVVEIRRVGLAVNGLRISEALKAVIDKLSFERGHRTLTVLRKGGKIVVIPLAPPTARAIDLAIGERLDGPIFLRPDGQRMDRRCASRIVRRIARRAGWAAGSHLSLASAAPSVSSCPSNFGRRQIGLCVFRLSDATFQTIDARDWLRL
jgi:hypothetical protein